MKHKILLLFFVLMQGVLIIPDYAASENGENDSDRKRLLPGEEVTTQDGKKMKVWSTEGPVPVSKAPEPFEDTEKSVLPSGVIVDAEVRGPKYPIKDERK